MVLIFETCGGPLWPDSYFTLMNLLGRRHGKIIGWSWGTVMNCSNTLFHHAYFVEPTTTCMNPTEISCEKKFWDTTLRGSKATEYLHDQENTSTEYYIRSMFYFLLTIRTFEWQQNPHSLPAEPNHHKEPTCIIQRNSWLPGLLM